MWALKKRLRILFILAVIILAFFSIFYTINRYRSVAFCNDNIQNGSETGIDCGGVCPRICIQDTRPLRVSWARVVPVTDTVYTIAVEIENLNYDAVGYRVEYSCSLLTSEYKEIQTIHNKVMVPPSGRYPFVVPSIRFALEGVPRHANCVISSNHQWYRLPSSTIAMPLSIQSPQLDNRERPRASARIVNIDRMRTFSNFTVTALVYDSTQSVVAASQTVVQRLEPGMGETVQFTWPNEFSGTPPYRVEMSPVFEFPDFELMSKRSIPS